MLGWAIVASYHGCMREGPANFNYPYQNIGNYLKRIRERLSESVGEVSASVEIDITMLNNIESGHMLPSEEILILLMSHFDLDEPEAQRLLKLAGYGSDSTSNEPQIDDAKQQLFALVPFDSRIQYAEHTEISANENGITISFMQQNMNGQNVPAARIGLSKTHAKKLIHLLEQALSPVNQKPRLLNPPSNIKSHPAKN